MKETLYKKCEVEFEFQFGSTIFNDDFISICKEEQMPGFISDYSNICVIFQANLYDNKLMLIKTLDLLIKDSVENGVITVNFLSKDGTVYYKRKYIGVAVKDDSYKNVFDIFDVDSEKNSNFLKIPVYFSFNSIEETIL